jgi:nucleoside-diphosphate-sugar epimerase
MTKVLVTGSEGSLMQAVIPLLLKKGYVVVGVDNLSRYGERMGHAGNDYQFIKADLTDKPSVDKLIENSRPDYIIQAAATIYGVGGFNKYCADMYKDITLHENVLSAAVKAGLVKKVVYISSSMVYENCPQIEDTPVYEDMPDKFPAPYTDYGLSKFVGERLSQAYFKQHGLPYTIWRPFNIITPYEKSEAEDQIGISHVFADYIQNIVVDRVHPLPIIGDGEQVRCFTWIEEVAAGIVDNLENPETVNETYNLGNPEPITMKQLAEKIMTIASEEFKMFPSYQMEYKTTFNYNNDVRVRIPDVHKARKDLKWEARMKVDDSIRLCIKEIASK